MADKLAISDPEERGAHVFGVGQARVNKGVIKNSPNITQLGTCIDPGPPLLVFQMRSLSVFCCWGFVLTLFYY